MTPTIAQRLGLEPLSDPSGGRRTLLAARAAAGCFAVLGVLVLGAAGAGGDLGAVALGAAAVCACFSALLLGAYEHLPRTVNHLLALAGTLVIATLTLLQPAGELYAPLYLGIVVYVTFFFNRAQALLHLGLAVGLWALAALAARPVGDAVELWILGAGTLTGTALVTRAMRDRLVRAAEQARHDRKTLDAFFLHAPGGFAFLDAELHFVRANEAFAEAIGRRRDEIEARSIREVAPEHADVLEPLARRVLETGEAALRIELTTAGGRRHQLISYFPVPGPSGELGVGTSVIDITHLKHVERRLEETNRRLTVLASTDELTGLPNRRRLDEQLELALARARRAGLGVALLTIDLDRFKEVNDSLGHGFGDDLLVEVAARLRTGARETDVVARVGGDEFVILLADLDVQDAPALAATVVDRLRAALEEQIAIGPVELSVDASIGVAIYPLDSRDARGLCSASDAAMYAGKNLVSRVA